jgi:hypothetical protein
VTSPHSTGGLQHIDEFSNANLTLPYLDNNVLPPRYTCTECTADSGINAVRAIPVKQNNQQASNNNTCTQCVLQYTYYTYVYLYVRTYVPWYYTCTY